jgi:protein PhnA
MKLCAILKNHAPNATKLSNKGPTHRMIKLSLKPELHSFLSTYIMEADLGGDESATQAFIERSSEETQNQVIKQIKELMTDQDFPIEEFGSEANRWFETSDETKEWLSGILGILEISSISASSNDTSVKDSNGAILVEGDSVQVIKDLKVKGGSSDLKRGTLIKKIHLIGDPDHIECRVDGSTLVLKTCFLKKT